MYVSHCLHDSQPATGFHSLLEPLGVILRSILHSNYFSLDLEALGDKLIHHQTAKTNTMQSMRSITAGGTVKVWSKPVGAIQVQSLNSLLKNLIVARLKKKEKKKGDLLKGWAEHWGADPMSF